MIFNDVFPPTDWQAAWLDTLGRIAIKPVNIHDMVWAVWGSVTVKTIAVAS